MVKKVETRSAWTSETLQKSPLWGYELNKNEVAGLIDALHAFKKAGHTFNDIEFNEIQKSMFPLNDTLAQLCESMRAELEEGTGAVLIRNLPVDQFDDNDMAIIHAGISKYIGNVVRQAGGRVRSETRGHGKYLGKVVAEMSGSTPANGKQSDNKFLLHTDVCDTISLLCMKNSGSGYEEGGSIIASALGIYNEMVDSHPELVEELFKPVSRLWTVSESLHCEIPIWKFYGNGTFTTQLTPVYTEVAQLLDGVTTITKNQVLAMNELQNIGYRIGHKFSLAPGDCYFLNNHLAYHGRSSWNYDPSKPQSRVMLRTWVSPYKNRALPNEPDYIELWGSIEADAPRGRAYDMTDDADAVAKLNAMNKRLEGLAAEGKYDYYDLFNNYDKFMANIAKKDPLEVSAVA